LQTEVLIAVIFIVLLPRDALQPED
jgi:hypothetical protein